MIEEFHEAVPCPECGAPLETVQIERVTVLDHFKRTFEDDGGEDFFTDEGFEDNGQGSVTVRCYRCGKVIGQSDANNRWGLFPKTED